MGQIGDISQHVAMSKPTEYIGFVSHRVLLPADGILSSSLSMRDSIRSKRCESKDRSASPRSFNADTSLDKSMTASKTHPTKQPTIP
jgi:hypothetical protein